MNTIDGIDVSQVQGKPDWSQVLQNGFRFAYMKATEGQGYVDPVFLHNAEASRMDGLYMGGYAYIRPSHDISKQLSLFKRVLDQAGLAGKGALPPALDLETRSNLSAVAAAAAFEVLIKDAEQAFGRKPMLYTYTYFWQMLLKEVPSLKDNETFRSCPLWHANYGPKMAPWYPKGKAPPALRPWGDALMWQYSGNNGMKVPGVYGDCDRNFFFGTEDELRSLCLLDPLPPAEELAA